MQLGSLIENLKFAMDEKIASVSILHEASKVVGEPSVLHRLHLYCQMILQSFGK